MAEGPDSQAIKKLLDNPVVSDDVKRELIWAYGSRHGDRAPDLQRYADRLGMTGTGIPVPLGRPIGDLDKAVDDVYKELNKHEAENGKQVLGEAGNEASSSNSILDLGAPGLRYFEYFGPLYQKCVVGTEICRDKACQLYDEQRDMNLGVLRTDSAILTKGAAKLSEEITTQRNAWSTVDQLWTGQGAEAANSYVDGYLGQAGTAQAQVEKFATVLRPAADALENAVRDKAQFVAMLYADTIGGKTPDQIDEIIYYTQHGHDIVTSLPEAARIVHMFGASAARDGVDIVKLVLNPVFGGSSAAMDLLDKAKQFATNFVDNVFKPDVEGKWRGFVDTCTATDRSVREIYQRITAEANTTNDHPFSASTGTLPPVTASRHKPGADHQLGNPRADDGGDRTQVAGNPAQLHPQQVQHTPTTPPPVAHAGLGIPRDASRPQPVPAVSPQAFMPPRPSGLLSPTVPGTPGTAVPGAGMGVAWLRDPSKLPQGWAVNPNTGELTPPAPGTAADAVGRTGTGPAITITDGSSTLTVGAEEGGARGVTITVSDPAGHQSDYTVELGPDGLPHLTAGFTPVDTAVPAGGSGAADAGIVADRAVDAPPSLIESSAPVGVSPDVSAMVDTTGSPDATAADQSAPADNSVQVRTASATGWGDSACADGQGAGPLLAHADSAPSSVDEPASAGLQAVGLNMGQLHGDMPLRAGDQWLLGGVGDDADAEWDSLTSVLAPDAGSPTANGGGTAVARGNAGPLWR